MKQYKITTDNLNQDSADDCVLDPSDPINEIKTIKYLAGLGSSAKLHEYKPVDQGSNISITGNEKGQLMKKNNIKPGTPEWFKLWFSKPYLTGEKPT
jgi:hypothetical protein